MAIANLALRFVAELLGIGAVAYWGSRMQDGPAGIAVGIGAALALSVAWAVLVAPKARNRLMQPQRDVVGTGLLLVSAAALVAAGQPTVGIAFAAAVIVNWILLVAFGPDARATLGAAAATHR